MEYCGGAAIEKDVIGDSGNALSNQMDPEGAKPHPLHNS
jgi:hypothetical protein